MTRMLGIPVAAIALVGLPSLVAQPSAPAPPPAKEAALTVNLEGDQGGRRHPYDLSVTAEGPPPTSAARLRDASGLQTATVAPAKGCQGTTRVAFADGGDQWCLRLEDVANGHELTGVTTGGGDGTGKRGLSLTVNRRDSFLWGPLLVMIAGFLAGTLAIFYKTAMRKPIRRTVLGDLLRDNAKRGPKRIIGLNEFVRRRLAAGEAIDDLIAKIAGVLDNGPALAATARNTLKEVMKERGNTLDGHALQQVALDEVQRTDNRIGDFYADDGSARTHPAAELEGMVRQMCEELERVTTLREEIAALAATNRSKPTDALARVELVAKKAVTVAELARVGTLLDDARDAVEEAQAQEAAARRPRRLKAPTRARTKEEMLWLPAQPHAEATELGGSGLIRTKLMAIALTVSALVAVLGVAIVTVKHSAYDPKLTFASSSDYVTLFLAALGSSAAGSAVLVLSLWSPTLPLEES